MAAYLMVRHTAADYDKWKPAFDGHSSARKAGGEKGGWLLRNTANPNEIVVLFEWDNLDNARKFVESPELREVMQRAGVVSRPDILFLDLAERLT
jgi:heme-degrading monooxygenase HmoA